ncbi:/ recA / Recombinase A /:104567 Forward [Candidatus Hepatoplasma crinochetorum]|uniref:Protein RecA n=1 Tax=Candidatus Hepatoplasma crinochetorum TaxID=295596 RepID=A0A0G7ZM17_9MOLU|nr:/ recA / Recombinase A /:104567 Forward [Candidatus Hepatoplasma crinochetorum]
MKQNELNSLFKEIEREFGKGSILNLDNSKNYNISKISTGSYLLDDAIGIGGYPKGRIVEIFGPESSGKTTLALLAIAEAQKEKDKYAAFIDAEHSLDVKYAQKLGVNLEQIAISQPDSGEQGMEIAEKLIASNLINILVIDSVAALTPIAEIEGSMEEVTIGAQARLMSKSLRKLSGLISKSETIVIFINQIREKVGNFYGNKEITPGGKALKFFSTIRFNIRVIEKIKGKDGFIGQTTKIKVIKNKVSSPYKEANVTIYYNEGIDRNREIFDLALKKEILSIKGSWIYYKNEKIAQGKDSALNYLIENNKIKELKDEIFN